MLREYGGTRRNERPSRRISPPVGSSNPAKLYNDANAPLATVALYPYPTENVSLELYSWQALAQFADLVTPVALPDGYEEAVIYNLAVRLAPEYGRALDATVAALAIQSKAAIEALNAPSPAAHLDPAIFGSSRRAGFNWLTGELG